MANFANGSYSSQLLWWYAAPYLFGVWILGMANSYILHPQEMWGNLLIKSDRVKYISVYELKKYNLNIISVIYLVILR